jgi:hypothetical protein
MALRDILVLPKHPLSDQLALAIATADVLHRVPPVEPFPVVIRHTRAEQGSYHCQQRPLRPIEIRVSSKAVYPALTLLHEIGHFLDNVALNPIRAGFGSDYDDRFAKLLVTWTKSDLVQQLGKLLDRHGHRETNVARRNMKDQLTPRELFARSYMQWVVTHSGVQDMHDALATSRQAGAGSRIGGAPFNGSRPIFWI